jgi:hypothetical protein
VGTENKIYVTYVVPLNESRGIYVIDSQNMGLTWSDPTTVFDAAASGWSMVGRVQMTQTQNGDFHALWQQLELPVGREPLALFYANSQDNGRSWSTPDRVAEKPAQWSRLVSDGSQMIFRFWQEASQGRVGLWYQRSEDRGQVWSEPELVFGFGDFSQATDVVADQAGQLHLLKMVDTDIEQPLLREWLWQGTNWITENEATFSSPSLVEIETKLAAMIGDNGRLGILYSRAASVPFTLDAAFSLHYVDRLFTLPENAIIIPSPTAVSTSTAPAPTETPTPQPSATERPIFSTDGLPTPTNSISDSPVGSIIVGLLPAGLIVIGVVIFSLYFSRLRKNL